MGKIFEAPEALEFAMMGSFLHEVSLFVRYDGEVGNTRTCVVAFVDSTGIRHSVEVMAESHFTKLQH